MAAPSSKPYREVRALLALVAEGHAIEPSHCRHWSAGHLRIIRRQRLGPWLHVSLRPRADETLPTSIRDGLKTDYRESVMRTLTREASTRRLLGEFETAGIPIVVLKGAHLAACLYPDPAMRPMADVDILVQLQDCERARDLLSSMGYAVAEEPPDEFEELVRPSLLFGVEGPTGGYLDLHWGLQAMNYYRLSPVVVWEEARESSLLGNRAHLFSPEMNFIHVGLHALNHGSWLLNWLDLVLLTRARNMDWDRLTDLSERLEAARPLYRALLRLQEEWHVTVPSDTLSRLARYRARWFEDFVIRGPYARFWRVCARLRYLPDRRSGLRYIAARLFRSRR
ncbi:nucleotidyltransferase family protein [Thermodesulfobacteriota bacterium]